MNINKALSWIGLTTLRRAVEAESMRDALIETARKEGDVVIDGTRVSLFNGVINGRLIVTKGAREVMAHGVYFERKEGAA